jgi:hypothetical protein
MSAWIFQGNPDKFDMDEYLARTHEIQWTVSPESLSKHMRVGDKMFMWRAAGRGKAISGIIAVGHLSGEPRVSGEDEASQGLWRNRDNSPALRVPMTLDDVATGPLKRERLKRDPILSERLILRFANQTTYRLQPREALRLSQLWDNKVRGGETPPPPVYEYYGDAPNDLQTFAAHVRKGQPAFRKNLLAAYGERCVVTGSGPKQVLEAVHILSHAGSGINELDNGLLMRADIHTFLMLISSASPQRRLRSW